MSRTDGNGSYFGMKKTGGVPMTAIAMPKSISLVLFLEKPHHHHRDQLLVVVSVLLLVTAVYSHHRVSISKPRKSAAAAAAAYTLALTPPR
jgi:hypothetical protein